MEEMMMSYTLEAEQREQHKKETTEDKKS